VSIAVCCVRDLRPAHLSGDLRATHAPSHLHSTSTTRSWQGRAASTLRARRTAGNCTTETDVAIMPAATTKLMSGTSHSGLVVNVGEHVTV
jgi:hypothetical protein